MSTHEPKIPAKEVLRFGGQVVLRLLLGVMFGLGMMKTGEALLGWGGADAITYGEIATAAFFCVSFLIRAVPYPEVDYGELPEQSLLDEPPTV